jgi:RNA polymerase sigma factor (sigma-70 family)
MGPRRPPPPPASHRAFVAIFERHTGAVQRTLRRLRIPRHDLPDVEQDTWLAIWRALERLDGALPAEPGKLSCTIAYRKGANHLKACERRPAQARSLTAPEPADESPSSEQQIMQSEEEKQARALVLSLLDDLPLNERAVVVLADFEPHRSMGEIAEELDISEEAARSRHRRAHEQMRQSLERHKQKEQPVLACALLPAVAALSLDELLSVEAPAPPLSPREHAQVWDRVLLAIGGKAFAVGGGALATMLTAKQAAAGALLAFALGGAADELVRAAHAPAPAELVAEAAPIVASVSAPSAVPPPLAEPAPSVVVVVASVPTIAPVVVANDLGPEWQAIREARALLRGKQPAPEAALEALKRVRSPQLHELREQLRAEATTMQHARTSREATLTP